MTRNTVVTVFASALLAVAALVGSYSVGQNHARTVVQTVTHEQQAPGLFEGKGAIELQCLWGDDTTDITDTVPDLDKLPARALMLVAMPGGDWDGTTLLGVARKSNGLVIQFDGTQCGYSIDWSAFPPATVLPPPGSQQN